MSAGTPSLGGFGCQHGPSLSVAPAARFLLHVTLFLRKYFGYRSSGFQLTSFSMEQLKRGTLMEQSTAVGLPPSLSIPNIHSLLVSVTWPIV